MNNLSNERLKELSNVKMICMCQDEEYQSMALELLAYREAQGKPVYQERRYHVKGEAQIEYWADVTSSTYGYLHESQRRILYTAPQLSAIPDEYSREPCVFDGE